eukprot:762158-Hanusia_phi.AAC.2
MAEDEARNPHPLCLRLVCGNASVLVLVPMLMAVATCAGADAGGGRRYLEVPAEQGGGAGTVLVLARVEDPVEVYRAPGARAHISRRIQFLEQGPGYIERRGVQQVGLVQHDHVRKLDLHTQLSAPELPPHLRPTCCAMSWATLPQQGTPVTDGHYGVQLRNAVQPEAEVILEAEGVGDVGRVARPRALDQEIVEVA